VWLFVETRPWNREELIKYISAVNEKFRLVAWRWRRAAMPGWTHQIGWRIGQNISGGLFWHRPPGAGKLGVCFGFTRF
jgi:hypothetical protein